MSTPRKKSSVRHTRAIGRDRQKHPSGEVSPEQIEAIFEEVVHPATLEQVAEYKRRGHRERTLTLPIMTALVLSLLWRGLGSVREAVRLLNEEGVLWTGPVAVSAQAVTDRLRTLPSELFRGVLFEVLPRLHARWGERDRPLPAAVAWARERYTAVLALDGSTLDALQKKVSLSEALPERKGLAGRMAALLDVASHLPHTVWYEEDSQTHDQTFWERALEAVSPGALVLMDLGFVNYGFYDRLTRKGVTFVTRLKSNAAFRVLRTLREGPKVQDRLIALGSGTARCEGTVRVVAVLYGGKWYRYLTNELDPARLPAEHVVALYWQRWRIEDAFAAVKRLLGLSYFVVSSINGIEIQLWATWVLYAILSDLTDAVAQRLKQPYQMISVEMVYRGSAHFTRAFRRGAATDPVEYLAQKAKLLGIVKQKRPKSLVALHLLTSQLNA
jgi:hypothetical protein